MRVYPTMTYRKYIRKFASKTENGKFFCSLCITWIDKQRWVHFKKHHRFEKGEDGK